jgi:hypothetical protein
LGKKVLVKRFKQILKIGALGLGLLLAAALIANAILISTTGSRLEKRLAAIRNAGDPVLLADLARPTPPLEQNAAVFLGRARHDVEALAKELNQIDDSFTDKEGRSGETEQESIRAAQKAYPRAFQAYPHVLPLLEQAAACPDYNLELAYAAGPDALLKDVLTEVQRFREYTNILQKQASSLRAQGKRDEALHGCLVSFRLTRHLEREPLLIPYLVVAACRSVAVAEINSILRAGPVSDFHRTELDKELATNDDMRGYLQALKGERAYAISSFGTTIPVNWFSRAYFNTDECCLLDQMEEQMSLTTQPFAAVAASEARLKQWISGPFHPLSALQLPAVMKTREAMERVRAQIRCLRILNALQRHGPWHEKEPGLSELGLPAEAITDPYDGSPIKLKRVETEWLIYCVGPDLKDDGGQLNPTSAGWDIGLGPVPPNER